MFKQSLALRWVVCLCLIPVLGACSDSQQYASNQGGSAASSFLSKPIKRTVLLYMIGSDLESQGSEGSADLNEMVSAAKNSHANIVVQTGGADRVGWDSVRRLSIDNGILLEHENLGQLNMGLPKTFGDFLHWGIKKFPAEEYILVIWSHGAGAVNLHDSDYGLVGPDEIFEDSLSAAEIKQALARVTKELNMRFAIIGFDACLMGSIEVANLLQPYADHLLASQELEPGNGWNYKAWLSALAQQPGMSSQALGKQIIDSYFDFYLANDPDASLTLSFTDLRELPGVVKAADAWAEIASRTLDSSEQAAWAFSKARSKSESYGREGRFDAGMVDLNDFINTVNAQLAKADLQAETKEQARETQAAVKQLREASGAIEPKLKQAVVYSRSSKDRSWASGLSTFIPSSFQLFNSESRHAVSSQIEPLPMSDTWKGMLDSYRRALEDAEIDLEISSVEIDKKSSKLRATMHGNPDLVQDVFFAVFEDKGNQITILGNALVDEDTSVKGSSLDVSLNDAKLLSINGQIAFFYIVDVTDDYWLLSVPAVINGQESDVFIQRNLLGDMVTFKILGYKVSSNDSRSKYKSFKPGDSLQLMYPKFPKDDAEDISYVAKQAALKLTSKLPVLALTAVQKRASSKLGFYYLNHMNQFSVSSDLQPY